MKQIYALMIRLRFLLPSLLLRPDSRLEMDVKRWKEIAGMDCTDRKAMAYLLWYRKEFRNLVIYRHRMYPIRRRLLGLFYRPLDTLYFDTPEIGGGLYIQHGFATMIAAKSIGENCWINQQVTIGYKGEEGPPVIGDWVMITCGAKVLGGVKVGSHTTIAANAVVIHDVPDNCTVGGVPAGILRRADTEA